jgi:hypothetical protein
VVRGAVRVAVFDGEIQRATIRTGLPAGDNVFAEARRLGKGTAKRRQRHQFAIGEDFGAFVDAVVGVSAGLIINDAVRIADFPLEPARQLQVARVESEPVPSISASKLSE